MNLELKKPNNQIYIVDVNDKVISTLEQIDIDNLWDKYLEALAENKKITAEFKTPLNSKEVDIYTEGFKEGYIQAKKETCFDVKDLNMMYFAALGHNDFNEFVLKLKIMKIPECKVEIKQTNNKVTITKIIL